MLAYMLEKLQLVQIQVFRYSRGYFLELSFPVRIYFIIIQFHFLKFLTYPFEMSAMAIRRMIEIGFLILFWSVVIKSSDQAHDLRYIISYFLIGSSIADVVSVSRLRFGQYMQNTIKNGEITNVFLRPVNSLGYLFVGDIGRRGMVYILALITFCAGLMVQSSITTVSVLHFLLALGIALAIGFSLNTLVGMITFYTVEARSVRFVIEHVIRIFSGLIIPLSYFPEPLRTWVGYTPFPSFVYGPVTALKEPTLTSSGLQSLFIGGVWAVILGVVTVFFWKKAVNNYDAVGL